MKKYLFILFACIFVIMIGFGITLPVLPFYIKQLALQGGETIASASIHVGILTGIYALVQFFFAPVWGKLSDRLGRKPLLVIGLSGYSVAIVSFGLGTSLVMLYTARMIGGVFAAAILPVANAYVADITSEEERGPGMAWLGGAAGLGLVFGPAIGSFLSQVNWHLNSILGHLLIEQFSLPFIIAGFLSLPTLVLVIIWLPESLELPCLASAVPGNNVFETKKTKFPLSCLLNFLLIAFTSQFALATFEGTFALHARGLLNFGPSRMGIVFVICGFTMAVVQGIFAGSLIAKLGEKRLFPVGFMLMILGLTLLMFVSDFILILFCVTIFAGGVAFIIPSLSSLVSKQFSQKSGTALGWLNAANSLGQAAGPGLGGFLLTLQIHLPYLLAILLLSFSAFSGIIPMIFTAKQKL
ncbi:MAG TPA: MFS transporter [Bacteroidetes bacterium]|nr:MFS transporter [Bacteroidota bacterium]